MSDIKRLLSGAYILGYSDARNDKAIDPISAIERLTMNLNKRDLISRQDAIDAIYGITSYKGTIPLESAIFNIQKVPSVERVGKWIELDSDNDKYDKIKCDYCKKKFTVDAYHWTDIGFTKDDLKYCPNCGAGMEGEEE